MLIDNLLSHNLAGAFFRGLPVYDLGNVEPVLTKLGVADWNVERFSEREKTPPEAPAYVEYKWNESGPNGGDNWTIGVHIQEAPREMIEGMIEAADPVKSEMVIPEGDRRFYLLQQFEMLTGCRRPDGKQTKYPMAKIIHNLMCWCLSLEDGTNARIQAFVPTGLDGDRPPSPFKFDRVLSSYKDPYFPVGCPWVPFAVFGLQREGRLRFGLRGGRNVLAA